VLPRKFKMVLTPAVSGVGTLGGEVLTAMSARAGLNGAAVRRRLFALALVATSSTRTLAKLRGFEPLAFPAETSRRILSILYDMTDRGGTSTRLPLVNSPSRCARMSYTHRQ
jgi:hypothetical protein